jgi:hypothetical protein
MEITPNPSITSPISFDEAWEALSAPVQAMLSHLQRVEVAARQRTAPLPSVHRQSS